MRGARPRRAPPASGQGLAKTSRDGECDAQDGDCARLLGRRLRSRGGGDLRILLTCAYLARPRRGEAAAGGAAGGAAVQGTPTSAPSTSASSAALPPTAQCGAFRASAASSSVSACRRPTCARQSRERARSEAAGETCGCAQRSPLARKGRAVQQGAPARPRAAPRARPVPPPRGCTAARTRAARTPPPQTQSARRRRTHAVSSAPSSPPPVPAPPGLAARTTSRARDAVCSSRVRRSVGPRSAPTACACPPAARGHALATAQTTLATAQMPPAPRAAPWRGRVGQGKWGRARGRAGARVSVISSSTSVSCSHLGLTSSTGRSRQRASPRAPPAAALPAAAPPAALRRAAPPAPASSDGASTIS
jgi:hypothetical protein